MRFSQNLIPSLLCVVLLVSVSSSYAVGTVYPLLENGSVDERINVVFVAEGYTTIEEAEFIADANTMLAYMLAQPPFDFYSSFFNGYAVFVASNESGSDHPSMGIYKDTYLSSTYDSYGIQRLITIPPNDFDFDPTHGSVRLYALLADNLPEYDMIVIVVNDNIYGGSGGAFAITSVHTSSPEIVVHEVGHSYGQLADEYAYSKSLGRELISPNVTQETSMGLIPWTTWIDAGTPLPTPDEPFYFDLIGLFEGANYQMSGWYRPKHTCKMRVLGVPFCEVCVEAMVLAHYSLLSPISGVAPITFDLTIDATEQETLFVFPQTLPLSEFDVLWFVDGELSGSNDIMFVLDGVSLGLGTFQVKAVVSDTTSLVRNDPSALLRDSVMWSITVVDPPCCQGIRGNVDYSSGPSGDIDVSDVTYLVAYLFKSGPPPPCTEEGNVDGLIGPGGEIDVSDMTYLIAYLFKAGPDPALCP